MSAAFDLAVIGAGPAGCHAAMEASKAGLTTIIIDEADAAGGQVWRQPHAASIKTPSPGNTLRQQLSNSNVTLRFGKRIWQVEPGFLIHTIGDEGHETIDAERLVVAAGAHERVIPFPGWTLPGVLGLAATTILLKAHATLPGKRMVVAGRGPLLGAVAGGILDQGGEIAAIIDANGKRDWLAALPALRHRPADLRQGFGWWLDTLKHRVPWHGNSRIERIEAEADMLHVKVTGKDRLIECDAVAVGDGLTPSIEVVRLLGAKQHYDEQLGGWVPDLDAYGRCSLSGLYACGDGTGIRGAAVACETGKLAGLSAACDAGAIKQELFEQTVSSIKQRLTAIDIPAKAMASLTATEHVSWQSIPQDTVVCRCEDVTRDTLERAIESGAREPDQLKAWTRCGMGPCQGRMCGETAARLLAQATGRKRSMIQPWTPRIPIRPIPMADLLGDFDYEDIPIPAAAPL